MTAEEFLKNSKNVSYTSLKDEVKLYFIEQDLIEFAKMHVEEALKQASEKAYEEYIDLNTKEIFDYTDVMVDDGVGVNINKDSILNAYPLENIK
jgi:hypothetical protein